MNSPDEQPFLSPAQAAKRAMVSRPTISRALKSGELLAFRDNKARWQIKPDDLDRWVSDRAEPVHEHRSHTVQNTPELALREQVEQLKSDLASTREKLAGATARADAAENDRDAWRKQAQTLAARSWWPFRRSR